MNDKKYNGPLIDRRDLCRYTFYLMAAGAVVGLPQVQERPIRTFTKPDTRSAFKTGVDFTAYNQYAWVRGERVEIVPGWAGNTVRTDLVTWTNRAFANAMTFMPYVGQLGESDGQELDKALGKAKGYINDISLSFKPSPSGLRKDLVVRVSLFDDDYSVTSRRGAAERMRRESISGDPLYFFLRAALKDMVHINADRKPEDRVLSLELDAYRPLPVSSHAEGTVDRHPPLKVDEYRRRVDSAREILSDHHSDISLICAVNDSILVDSASGRFSPQAKGYLAGAKEVMLTVTPDWGKERNRFAGLEDKIKFIKDLGAQKLLVRLQLAQYTPATLPSDFRMKWVESNELEDALRLIKANAQGSFLEDTNGLLLYRGLVGSLNAVDDNYLQATAQRLHREFLGIRQG